MNKETFIKEYNIICETHLSKGSKLSDLTDNELHVWITGNTMLYGRNFKDSLANADFHMEDRKKAEKLFTSIETEIL